MATYVKKIDGNVIYAQRAEETGTGVNIDSALADKANKVANPQEGHFVGLNAQGELVDAGVSLGDYKTKQQPVSDPSMDGYTTAFIDTISQTDNGVITVTKKGVPTASSETAGLMSTNDKGKLDSIEYGANNYQHPTIYPSGEAPTLGLYKVALNEAGHVASVTNVVKQDIVDLGIPGSDTTYTASNGITLDGTTFKHTNNITGGTAGPGADTTGNTFTVTNVVYDDNGHITQTTTNQHTSFPLPSSDGEFLLGVTNDTSSTGSAPDWGELTKGLVGGNGILLDENNDPLLDENNNPLLDEHTAELWTEYKRTGFAAARAIADEDGNNIKNALDDKVERVFIENIEIAKTGHDVHIPLAVSESDTSNKKNGAMSSVDKYKVDAIEFPTTEDPYYLYHDNNDCNKIYKVGYPADGGYSSGYEEMLRIGNTASHTGNNDIVWLGSLSDLNDGKVGFYKLVGEITEPSDYRNASNWEPYNIGTIETSNTIDDKMVYLDTVNGDDANNGLTVDKPVQTVFRAFRAFANEFYYGDGKTARIRLLNDNATVILDNSYDDLSYEYFDWIAFYGTGNVAFVYDLEADDQGKIVDNKYRNNLWAEFDGNIQVVGSGHTYFRLLHIVSKYGDVTVSGTANAIVSGGTPKATVPEIYLNAGEFVNWTADALPSNGLINMIFIAGLGIYTTSYIKCQSIQLICGKDDIYLNSARVSPAPNQVTSGSATVRYINNKAPILANYSIFMQSDYISVDAPLYSCGTIAIKNSGRNLESETSMYVPRVTINSLISGAVSYDGTSSPTSYCNNLIIDAPKSTVTLASSVTNVIQTKIICHVLDGTDVSMNNTSNLGAELSMDASHSITLHGDITTGYHDIKLATNSLFANSFEIHAERLQMNGTTFDNIGIEYSVCGWHPDSGSVIDRAYIDFDNVELGGTILYREILHIHSANRIEVAKDSVIQAKQIQLDANTVNWRDGVESGGADIRCKEFNIIRKDGQGEQQPYLKLVDTITYGQTTVSTADVVNNVINIGRLGYVTDAVTSTNNYALLWVNKENSNIVATIAECNAVPFMFDCSTVKVSAKINMLTTKLYYASTLPANIDLKVVSDFDTDGTTPATVTGYNDYQYVVVSNVTAVNIHTQTLNS